MILPIVLPILIACEKPGSDDAMPFPEQQAQEIIDNLEEAYMDNSETKLKDILEYWHHANPCIRTSEFANEKERNIYEVFKAFYTPFDIGRLGQHEWGSDIYQGVQYIIIQNKIYYDFNYHPGTKNISDSIIDFRPDIHFDNGAKNLYLTLNYEIALNAFLGSDYFPLGTYGIMSPAVPDEESYKRQQFLNQYLMIFHGHWGGYWHLETHPEVSVMHFDTGMQKVRFYFRVIYMFGEAYLEKKDGRWELVSSDITMIE